MNGDGLFDLVILSDGGSAVYLNGGTAGNPMFTRAEGVSTNGLDLAQGSPAAGSLCPAAIRAALRARTLNLVSYDTDCPDVFW